MTLASSLAKFQEGFGNCSAKVYVAPCTIADVSYTCTCIPVTDEWVLMLLHHVRLRFTPTIVPTLDRDTDVHG